MPRRSTVLATLTALAAGSALAVAGPAGAATLTGTVGAGPVIGSGDPPMVRQGASVELFEARATGPRRLASTTTGTDGTFTVDHPSRPASAVLYVIATGGVAALASDSGTPPPSPTRSAVRLMSVLGRGGGDARVVVNELTTVASVVATQQYLHRGRLGGSRRGLRIAADTVQSLSETRTGKPSFTIANSPNGTATEALPTLGTLANVLARCTRGGAADCGRVLRAARAPGQPVPGDTLQAMENIAARPAHATRTLTRLQRRLFRPALRRAPRAFTIAIVHVGGGMNAPGRMAFDGRGRIWANSNFAGIGTTPGPQVTVLDPLGSPLLGSPLTGGGVDGSGFGIAVGPGGRVWLSNYSGESISSFSPGGRPLSPPGAFRQGDLAKPQGITVGPDGSLWIANSTGDHVTVYPGGNPRRARTVSGGGIGNSFDVAVDGQGAAWVTNQTLKATQGSVTRIGPGPAYAVTGPFTGPSMISPMGIAVDRGGDKWVADFLSNAVTRIDRDGTVTGTFLPASVRGGWGVAVDGDDNVWVAGFRGRTLTQLCGRLPRNCPPGAATGDPLTPPLGYTSRGLQHPTAVQVDMAGNVWMTNNWSDGQSIVDFVGGNGLIEFVGLAAPVATPLVGPPRRP